MALHLVPREEPSGPVRLSPLLSSLSLALDRSGGKRPGHALRGALIGMTLAQKLRLPLQSAFRRVDWRSRLEVLRFCATQVPPGTALGPRLGRIATLAGTAPGVAETVVSARSSEGARIVHGLGLGLGVETAIAAAGEHWDGGGYPRRLRGTAIPRPARLLTLAECIEERLADGGVSGAIALARLRAGRWFDPELVAALPGLEHSLAAWEMLDERALIAAVLEMEPGRATLFVHDGLFDRIAETFARVIDARSSFTSGHSEGVAVLAMRIGESLGRPAHERAPIRRAALLHDLGALALPIALLDKPGELTPEERALVCEAPAIGERILGHVGGCEGLAETIGAQHERPDGRGYPRALAGDAIPLHARILAVADRFEALTATRPDRPALPEETAFQVLENERDSGVDGDCLDALRRSLGYGETETRAAA